jgi:hypothetical protein
MRHLNGHFHTKPQLDRNSKHFIIVTAFHKVVVPRLELDAAPFGVVALDEHLPAVLVRDGRRRRRRKSGLLLDHPVAIRHRNLFFVSSAETLFEVEIF